MSGYGAAQEIYGAAQEMRVVDLASQSQMTTPAIHAYVAAIH